MAFYLLYQIIVNQENDVPFTILLNKWKVRMKKFIVVIVSIALLSCVAVSPVWAGGDKNQHERGTPGAPGPGDDAQGNQAD